MGAIQKPTRAMGAYQIELRSESFYLTRVDADPAYTAAPSRYEATLPAEDIPALLAALDQATSHSRWDQREQERPPGSAEPDNSWALAPGSDGPLPDAHWTVTSGSTTITIRGPWTVFHETDRNLLFTELCYRDLPALRAELTAAHLA